MSLSTLGLDSSWQDLYGSWNTFIEPLLAPLDGSDCHMPRYALIPDTTKQLVPVSGKITYNFHLVPGSFIAGFWLNPEITGSLQLTDVNLGHKFFQEPGNVTLMPTPGVDEALYPSFTLFPTPHPVVGDGLFTLEFWGQVASRFYMILLVAEVSDCQN